MWLCNIGLLIDREPLLYGDGVWNANGAARRRIRAWQRECSTLGGVESYEISLEILLGKKWI
jgi:hypothetical protein